MKILDQIWENTYFSYFVFSHRFFIIDFWMQSLLFWLLNLHIKYKRGYV